MGLRDYCLGWVARCQMGRGTGWSAEVRSSPQPPAPLLFHCWLSRGGDSVLVRPCCFICCFALLIFLKIKCIPV